MCKLKTSKIIFNIVILVCGICFCTGCPSELSRNQQQEVPIMASYSTTFANLNSLLQSLPANSVSTPYNIEITDITNNQLYSGTTLNTILYQNNTKYVSLYLSASNLTMISGSSFRNASNLVSLRISEYVTKIYSNPCNACVNLQNITVDSNNTNYKTENGVLYNFQKTSLIQYPIAKSETSFEIPSTVTTVEISAFESCKKLTSVIISNSVTKLGSNSFHSCTGLTSITFPISVTSIGAGAFTGCSSLSTVTFLHDYSEISNLEKRPSGQSIFNSSTINNVHLYDEATKAKFISEYESSFGLSGVTYVVDHIAYTESTGLFSNFESALVYLDANSPSTKYKFHLIELNQNRISGADTATEGTIQYTLQQNPTKYVSIEEDESCYQGNITSMQKAFKNCTNLVKFSGFPNGVTNLNECFSGCTNLSEVT